MICPACNKECVLKYNMFSYKDKYFSGFVCEKCNSLYDNIDDSMLDYAKKHYQGLE